MIYALFSISVMRIWFVYRVFVRRFCAKNGGGGLFGVRAAFWFFENFAGGGDLGRLLGDGAGCIWDYVRTGVN